MKHQPLAVRAQTAAAMPCNACDGRGHVRFTYPSNKPKPAYWFQKPCSPCEACGGTGEARND